MDGEPVMKKCPACDALYAIRLQTCPRCGADAAPASTQVPAAGWLRTRTRNKEKIERRDEPPTAPIDARSLRIVMHETAVRKSPLIEQERSREQTPQAVVRDGYVLVPIDEPVEEGGLEGTSEALIPQVELLEDSSPLGIGHGRSGVWEEEPTRPHARPTEVTPVEQTIAQAEEADGPITVESLLPAEIASEAYADAWSSEAEETREVRIGAEDEIEEIEEIEEIGLEESLEWACFELDEEWSADDAMAAVVAAADALLDEPLPQDESGEPAPSAPPRLPIVYPAVPREASTRGESRIREPRRPREAQVRAPVEVDLGDAGPMVVLFEPAHALEDPVTEELSSPLRIPTPTLPSRPSRRREHPLLRGVGGMSLLVGLAAAAWAFASGLGLAWLGLAAAAVVCGAVALGLAAWLTRGSD